MLYPAQWIMLLAAFLVPTSQAVVPGNPGQTLATTENHGYFCSLPPKVHSIHIHYGQNQGLPCRVTYHQGSKVTELLTAERNLTICESKAEVMAARLLDRGWHCQVAGLPAVESDSSDENF